MTSPQRTEPVSILKNSNNARSTQAGSSLEKTSSLTPGRTARIVVSEDDDEDYRLSDGDDEDAAGLPMSTQAIELLQTEKVLKSGYLLKKGEKRRTWKKRWFVLRTTKLAMYKDSKEYKLLRIIDLHEIHSVVHVTSKDKYKYMFAISTPKRMFYVQADNHQDMDAWILAIERAKSDLLLYDAEDDQSSVDRDQAFAKDVVTSYKHTHSQQQHQRRRSSAGGSATTQHHQPHHHHHQVQQPASPSADQGESYPPRKHVPPVDIPKARAGEEGLSSYSTSHTYPLSPLSDQGQLHVDGLASSDDDEEYSFTDELNVHHEETRNRVLIDGYLLKLGRNKGWRKRWFVLRTDTLAYYEDDKEYAPHRIIPLTHIIDSLEIDPMSRNKRYCFKIVIPKRSYVLCASSEDELEGWLNALSVAVRRAKKDENNTHPNPTHPTSTSPGTQLANTSRLQKITTGSSADSFENTSHISGVSGAGAMGGAGGALPGRTHPHHHSHAAAAQQKLGRAK